jgi:hypothetical protein
LNWKKYRNEDIQANQKLILDYLNELPNNEIVLFVDGRYSIIQSSLEVIERKFKESQQSVIIGHQWGILPYNFIGYVENVKESLRNPRHHVTHYDLHQEYFGSPSNFNSLFNLRKNRPHIVYGEDLEMYISEKKIPFVSFHDEFLIMLMIICILNNVIFRIQP